MIFLNLEWLHILLIVLKMLILDRGELLTYKPNYLSEKLSYLIENGLKDKLVKILIEEVEIFDEENEQLTLTDASIEMPAPVCITF